MPNVGVKGTGNFAAKFADASEVDSMACMHAWRYLTVSGLNLTSFLSAGRIAVHAPDASVAKAAADIAEADGLSLADRFALATTQALSARLYTTDVGLARAASRRRIPVSRL